MRRAETMPMRHPLTGNVRELENVIGAATFSPSMRPQSLALTQAVLEQDGLAALKWSAASCWREDPLMW